MKTDKLIETAQSSVRQSITSAGGTFIRFEQEQDGNITKVIGVYDLNGEEKIKVAAVKTIS